MISKLDKYFRKVIKKPAAICATLLDPRIKMSYFEVGRLIWTHFLSSRFNTLLTLLALWHTERGYSQLSGRLWYHPLNVEGDLHTWKSKIWIAWEWVHRCQPYQSTSTKETKSLRWRDLWRSCSSRFIHQWAERLPRRDDCTLWYWHPCTLEGSSSSFSSLISHGTVLPCNPGCQCSFVTCTVLKLSLWFALLLMLLIRFDVGQTSL